MLIKLDQDIDNHRVQRSEPYRKEKLLFGGVFLTKLRKKPPLLKWWDELRDQDIKYHEEVIDVVEDGTEIYQTLCSKNDQ